MKDNKNKHQETQEPHRCSQPLRLWRFGPCCWTHLVHFSQFRPCRSQNVPKHDFERFRSSEQHA